MTYFKWPKTLNAVQSHVLQCKLPKWRHQRHKNWYKCHFFFNTRKTAILTSVTFGDLHDLWWPQMNIVILWLTKHTVTAINNIYFLNKGIKGIPLFDRGYNRKGSITPQLLKIAKQLRNTSERAQKELCRVKIWRLWEKIPIFGEFLKISQNLQKPKIANYRETIDFLYSTWIWKVVGNDEIYLCTTFQHGQSSV